MIELMSVSDSANNAAEVWNGRLICQKTVSESPSESSLFALIGGESFHSDNGGRKIRGADT
ncbi:MAG: hypothetical protein V3R53_00865, partial [Gammaproteobacteria bacterium]